MLLNLAGLCWLITTQRIMSNWKSQNHIYSICCEHQWSNSTEMPWLEKNTHLVAMRLDEMKIRNIIVTFVLVVSRLPVSAIYICIPNGSLNGAFTRFIFWIVCLHFTKLSSLRLSVGSGRKYGLDILFLTWISPYNVSHKMHTKLCCALFFVWLYYQFPKIICFNSPYFFGYLR